VLRIFIIATILGASTLTYSVQSFAAEKGEKRLNKKERQALKIRNEKLGHISYMCISALAISAANNQSISQTPQFKASQSFWDTNVRQATKALWLADKKLPPFVQPLKPKALTGQQQQQC